MINEVINHLKNELNAYFLLKLGDNSSASNDKVIFANYEKGDSITFPTNALAPLLINAEEEKILRQPDPYIYLAEDGKKYNVNPEIRVNLYVLFVSNFADYNESLKHLSLTLKFFQSNKIFNHENSPGLSEDIDTLTLELMMVPFAQQNEIWGSLRAPYRPSLLYKVKMITYIDEQPREVVEISDIEHNLQPSSN